MSELMLMWGMNSRCMYSIITQQRIDDQRVSGTTVPETTQHHYTKNNKNSHGASVDSEVIYMASNAYICFAST